MVSSGVASKSEEGQMSEAALRKLLERIRRMPNATPAETLAEFRRLLAAEQPKTPKH